MKEIKDSTFKWIISVCLIIITLYFVIPTIVGIVEYPILKSKTAHDTYNYEMADTTLDTTAVCDSLPADYMLVDTL